MRSTTKTRVQRRLEKKQALMLVALVLVISLVSFALGVIVGRNTVEPSIVRQMEEPRRVTIADNSASLKEQDPAAVKPEDEKLTFYDNLSKEEPAPIGSGINLPPGGETAPTEELSVDQPQSAEARPAAKRPQANEIVAEVKTPAAPASVQASEVSAPAPASAVAVSNPAGDKLPPVTKGGGWVVQVFASKSAADAGLLRDKLNGKGYPAFITEADLGKKGIWYRVLFGPYAGKAAAVQVQLFAEKKDKLKGFTKRR